MTPPAWAKGKDGKYRVFPVHLLTQFPDGKWGFSTDQLLRGEAKLPGIINTANPYWDCFRQFRHLFEEGDLLIGYILKNLKNEDTSLDQKRGWPI